MRRKKSAHSNHQARFKMSRVMNSKLTLSAVASCCLLIILSSTLDHINQCRCTAIDPLQRQQQQHENQVNNPTQDLRAQETSEKQQSTAGSLEKPENLAVAPSQSESQQASAPASAIAEHQESDAKNSQLLKQLIDSSSSSIAQPEALTNLSVSSETSAKVDSQPKDSAQISQALEDQKSSSSIAKQQPVETLHELQSQQQQTKIDVVESPPTVSGLQDQQQQQIEQLVDQHQIDVAQQLQQQKQTQQAIDEDQKRLSKQSSNDATKGSERSMKHRAFGGYLGLFGRKQRTNSANSKNNADQQVENYQNNRIRGSFFYPAPTAKLSSSTASSSNAPINGNNNKLSVKGQTKSLKHADYPEDYKEILVQPDYQVGYVNENNDQRSHNHNHQSTHHQKSQQQSSNHRQPSQQQHQAVEVQTQSQLAFDGGDLNLQFEAAKQQHLSLDPSQAELMVSLEPGAATEPTQQLQQQQMIEHGTENPNVQQETIQPVIEQQQQQEITQQIVEQNNNGQSSTQLQMPYVRLSNIATINSTSNQPDSGNLYQSNGTSVGGSQPSYGGDYTAHGIVASNSSAEMKLMRIYVIDLDQKLVVGNNHQQASKSASHEPDFSTVQQSLSTSAGAGYATDSASGQKYLLLDRNALQNAANLSQLATQVLTSNPASISAYNKSSGYTPLLYEDLAKQPPQQQQQQQINTSTYSTTTVAAINYNQNQYQNHSTSYTVSINHQQQQPEPVVANSVPQYVAPQVNQQQQHPHQEQQYHQADNQAAYNQQQQQQQVPANHQPEVGVHSQQAPSDGYGSNAGSINYQPAPMPFNNQHQQQNQPHQVYNNHNYPAASKGQPRYQAHETSSRAYRQQEQPVRAAKGSFESGFNNNNNNNNNNNSNNNDDENNHHSGHYNAPNETSATADRLASDRLRYSLAGPGSPGSQQQQPATYVAQHEQQPQQPQQYSPGYNVAQSHQQQQHPTQPVQAHESYSNPPSSLYSNGNANANSSPNLNANYNGQGAPDSSSAAHDAAPTYGKQRPGSRDQLGWKPVDYAAPSQNQHRTQKQPQPQPHQHHRQQNGYLQHDNLAANPIKPYNNNYNNDDHYTATNINGSPKQPKQQQHYGQVDHAYANAKDPEISSNSHQLGEQHNHDDQQHHQQTTANDYHQTTVANNHQQPATPTSDANHASPLNYNGQANNKTNYGSSPTQTYNNYNNTHQQQQNNGPSANYASPNMIGVVSQQLEQEYEASGSAYQQPQLDDGSYKQVTDLQLINISNNNHSVTSYSPSDEQAEQYVPETSYSNDGAKKQAQSSRYNNQQAKSPKQAYSRRPKTAPYQNQNDEQSHEAPRIPESQQPQPSVTSQPNYQPSKQLKNGSYNKQLPMVGEIYALQEHALETPSLGASLELAQPEQATEYPQTMFYNNKQRPSTPYNLNQHQVPRRPHSQYRPPSPSDNGPSYGFASYGRPAYQQATRSLLSWETISSVATGAAKRIPTLFMQVVGGGNSYSAPPPPPRPVQYHLSEYNLRAPMKSSHFAGDVANFHKPYPLRHMNSLPATHSGRHQGRQQYAQQRPAKQFRYPTAESQDQESMIELQQTLSSSTSSQHQPGEHEVGQLVEPMSPSSAAEQEQGSPAESPRPRYNNQTRPHKTATASNTIETPDLTAVKVAAASTSKAIGASKAYGSAEPVATPSDQLGSEQAAVLASIEQQLQANEPGSPEQQQQQQPTYLTLASSGKLIPSGRSRPLIKRPRRVKSPEHAAAAAAMRPHLTVAQDVDSDDLPPAAGASAGYGSSALLGSGGDSDLPGPLNQGHVDKYRGVHIGNYKITPQTQFVNSIIEPSRQMFGQYFKQYINQLGQIAG